MKSGCKISKITPYYFLPLFIKHRKFIFENYSNWYFPMKIKFFLSSIILLLVGIIHVNAETIISGLVLDANTKQPLPAANIQISGTYKGTISNVDGFFVITIDESSAILTTSYIGYKSKSTNVSFRDLGREIKILLEPIIFEGETITVIAEDPGMQIMREVIKRKKIWREKLTTYQAKAYSRVVIENDSGIVSLAESTSETFWDKEKGNREVIKSKEQSSNLQEEYNIAFASYIPNLYDDDISIAGYQMIGPTHPDAMDYYRFKLTDITRMDNKRVFLIEVIPDSKLQPIFEGKVAVLDSAYALLEAELIPYENVRFPIPIQSWDIYYIQQFRNYGREFWLPVDLRMTGSIKIGMPGLEFPKIKYQRIASLSDYQVNIELPDSLYKQEDFLSVDSVSLAENKHIRAIPLSTQEDKAYEELDSTMTMQKAFKPTGFLARFVEMDDNSVEVGSDGRSVWSYFSPSVWYNRVDELNAGINIDEHLFGGFSVRLGAAYKTGLKRGGYHFRLRYNTGKSVRWRFDAAVSTLTELRYQSMSYSRLVASALPLFALDDYFDYYWNKGMRLEAAARFPELRSTLALKYHYQEHSSLNKTSDFNMIWSDFEQRENPAIQEGILRSVEVSYHYGRQFVPFGVVGQKRIYLSAEHTLSGNFDFTVLKLEADWRIPTFLKRRLLPNALDLHIQMGTSYGDLPIQRFGALDAAFYAFTPFATFRSLMGRPLEGEKYAALFWEHNFRTVPFELLGIDFLVDKSISLIVYGGHGRTWISDQRRDILTHDYIYEDRVRHELGASINGIFSLIRMDFTYRIDQPRFYVGVGMTRFF